MGRTLVWTVENYDSDLVMTFTGYYSCQSKPAIQDCCEHVCLNIGDTGLIF